MPKPTLSPVDTTAPPLHELCTSFPTNPTREIVRDQHLDTFERVFAGSVDLLVLEGDGGVGKTTLLSQFAKRHPRTAISSFVTPMPRYGFDPAALRRDYASQLLSVLYPRQSFAHRDDRDGVLQTLIQKVKRRYASRRIYFILDGLTDISDPIMRQEVSRLLPIGHGFAVIISGEQKLLPSDLRDNTRLKTTQAVNFSLAEVRQYLAGLGLSDASVRTIYLECGKGIPAHLAAVRRCIMAGIEVDRMRGRGIRDLFDYEWEQVVTDGISSRVLGLISHSRHRLTVHTVSQILSVTEDHIREVVARLPFLVFQPKSSCVTFVSRAFADFASERLSSAKSDVIDGIVDYLKKRDNGEPSDVMDPLPTYYRESGRLEEVISFLSPKYFSGILNRSESLYPLREQLEIGMEVATELCQDGQLVQFGLECSAIREIEASLVSRSEIAALVTTEQVPEALSLAAACPLREDRLHLLAVIARCERERGVVPSEEITDQIRYLFDQIDARYLGDKAIDIAADLYPCFPDLAVDLVEQSSSRGRSENEVDIAYFRLSIATAVRQIESGGGQDDLELIRGRIRDSRLRGFTGALSSRGESADEIVFQTERLETASDKLFFLRKWLSENSERTDALDVAEYGLTTLIESTGYSPNIRVLRELSTPLLYSKDEIRARSLVRSIDVQGAIIEQKGPTEEVVRLQLNLAVAEFQFDVVACVNRLLEVCLEVDSVADLATKSSCLARCLVALRSVDDTGEIEEKEGLASLCREELEKAITSLLADTAEQVDVTRGIIRALGSFDVDRALAVAVSLNTAARREEALLVAIDAILENRPDPAELKSVRIACKGLRMQESLDHVAAAIAEHLAQRHSAHQTTVIEPAFELFSDLFFSVSDPIERCRVLCLLYGLTETGDYNLLSDSRDRLSEMIDNAVNNLEPGPSRIDVGFRVAGSIAEHHPEDAKKYLTEAESTRKTTTLSSSSAEWTVQACLRLAIRAFAGQLGRGFDAKDDIDRIRQRIENLPSTSLRAHLWGELAMHLYLQEHSDDGDRVVTERIIPLLSSMPEGRIKEDTIVAVSPVLYKNHRTTKSIYLDCLKAQQRDAALMACATFILEQHIPSDPYEDHDTGYSITYPDAVDLVELATEIKRDSLVYVLIVALADTLSSHGFSSRFSQQQKTDITLKIRELSRAKFPDQDNIRHDGYAIATDAQILRIERQSGKCWDELLHRTRDIPNRSDRALVLATIAQVLPPRESGRREEIFDEAIRATNMIPCSYDRLSRLSDLADMMARKSRGLARKCLTSAMSAFRRTADGADHSVFRRVIDTAFKIDADFAASLVSMADDDPARRLARHDLGRRLETLRSRQAIIDGPMAWDQKREGEFDLPYSAWLALGSLNSRRAHPAALDRLRPALRAAGRYSLRTGYPILAWVIENAVRALGGTAKSRAGIREIFEGAMRATELAEIAGASASVAVRSEALLLSSPVGEESIFVQVGERHRAIEFIEQWLSREAERYVYICDQYFGPPEVDLLKLIQSVVPGVEIAVLTSRRCQEQNKVGSLLDAYTSGWQSISDQKPPLVEIVVVGLEGSGKSPIHDRCILTKESGINLGMSWNSLGLKQDSTISVLSEGDVSTYFQRVTQFLREKRRVHGMERLSYETVTM